MAIVGGGIENINTALVSLTTGVTGVLPPANGGVASVSVSGQSYFYGPGLIFPPFGLSVISAGIVGASTQVRVAQFVLPISITVRKITISVTGAGAAASTITVGIYSADGNTKLLDSGTFNGASVTIQTNTITAVTFNPGTYFLAQTVVTSAAIPLASSLANTSMQTIINANVVRIGNAANVASAGGVLPATLGVITSTAINTTLAMFEP